MRFWQYFGVGKGMHYPYINVLFGGAEISIYYIFDQAVVPETPLLTIWQYFIDGEKR